MGHFPSCGKRTLSLYSDSSFGGFCPKWVFQINQYALSFSYIWNTILCAVTHLTLSSLMQCVEDDFRMRVIPLNSIIWKHISLQTDSQIIHKYKHLQKIYTRHHLMVVAIMIHWHQRNATLWAMPNWHISVEFITHTKRNQFSSTVTLTFTDKWNGGLEMKTSCEISTKNCKLVLSLCHHF